MRDELPNWYWEGVAAFPNGTRPYTWTEGARYYWWMAGFYDAQLGYHN